MCRFHGEITRSLEADDLPGHANCGFLHSAADSREDLHAHPATISCTSMISRLRWASPFHSFIFTRRFDSPRLLSPTRRPIYRAGWEKFSSALFINTDSADHLSRIARGFSSFLSMNNRLVELLRGRLSRLREVDHHRLSCLRVWLYAKSTGCPGNFGNNFSRNMRNHIHICIYITFEHVCKNI